MAVKDSEELNVNERYPLGDYSFRIERSSVPGSTNDKIEAICTRDGKNARKSIQVPSSTQLLGWYVEANETEASVYVTLKENIQPLDTSPVPQPISQTSTVTRYSGTPSWQYPQDIYRANCAMFVYRNGNSVRFLYASTAPMEGAMVCEHYNAISGQPSGTDYYNIPSNQHYTYADKTVYYGTFSASANWSDPRNSPVIPSYSISDQKTINIAWTMVYGNEIDPEPKDKLVARFPIEIGPAGGGPSNPGGWIDPGDWEDGWEEGDPTHTLYVEVTGALSGRHNDPIVDPSYSYIPADKDTVKDYGCGGDGGHGGGGGAGASTVVVHKFATNQANSKEVTVIARRHGYGSGGGKGGKGGDGCILVYY